MQQAGLSTTQVEMIRKDKQQGLVSNKYGCSMNVQLWSVIIDIEKSLLHFVSFPCSREI